MLREQLRGRRIRYTHAPRRRLAMAATKLGRKALRKLETLVTPDTLMRWYRRLVVRKSSERWLKASAVKPVRLPLPCSITNIATNFPTMANPMLMYRAAGNGACPAIIPGVAFGSR